MGEGKILMRLNSIQTVEVVNKGERSVMYSGLKSLGSGAHSNKWFLIQPYAKSHLRRKSTDPATEQGTIYTGKQ